MSKRYVVGYATRDGNTHEFRRYHMLSVALKIEDRLRGWLRVKYGQSIVAYTYDHEDPERGSLTDSDLED